MTIGRPKISVCMAAFQGERYITAQLRSVLDQLSEDDEVIVIDDHSTDGTREKVRALADPRVCLVEHHANQGVAKSFEEAISRATGSVIFLSDQDDLWAPVKVSRVLQVFDKNPEVTLVTTDASLIDEDGVQLGGSYYAKRGRFSPGFMSNLIRCKYLGCTMAFRSGLVSKVMPFPRGSVILHDIWIGVINSVSSGNTFYIDEPLVWYRRHSANFTAGRLSRIRQLRWRFHLLRAVTHYWIRYQLGRWV